MANKLLKYNNDIIIYTTDDGQVEIEVRLEDENVWLTQNAMAELFDTTRNNITMHIKNIFEEGELQENSVSKESLLTAKDGKNYKTKFYNLDLIISVGYRVKSIRGTQFRIWANKLIKEYLIKGYNLNVKRFKNNGGGVYFEEVLEKIRDIRSSEKVFWRKILDIYATSVDYNAKDEKTKEFFKTVQNKMHYAVHGNTAAEVIFNRVDSEKENIGLTNFKGNIPTKAETEIAKNYLSEKELDMLNRMVSAYLDVAEINALNMHPMTMKDWIKELDGFLTMTHKDILNGAGAISHEKAIGLATAKKLSKDNNVIIVDYKDINQDFIQNNFEYYKNVYFFKCDISRKEEILDLKQYILDTFGKLDYLVCNAGILPLPCEIDTITDENIDRTIDVNLKGTFKCLNILGNLIKETSTIGSIVNISSVDGLIGEPYGVIYSTTKAGIISLTKSFAS